MLRLSPQAAATAPQARGFLTRLTHTVLAHKRIVVGFWVVLTLVGMASAGSATKALKQKFSVPGKEGWITNQQIAARLPRHGRQRRAAAGGRDAARGRVGRTLPPCSANCARSKRACERALPGTRMAGYASTAQPGVPVERPAHDVRRRLPAARPHTGLRRQPRSGETRERSARRRDRRGRAGPPDRLRRARACRAAAARAPGVLLEALLGGLGALLVLAFVFGSFLAIVPILMAIVVDPHDLPGRVGPDDDHRSVPDRPVPDRADRPGRVDRLLAARRRALARGARPRSERRRGDRTRDADGRPRGGVQRHDGRDRPARAGRAAASVPALGRLRRHADPADQRDRRADAAAGRPQQARPAPGLAARAQRRQGQPLVDRLGAAGRAPALDRGARRRRSCSRRWCWRPRTCSWASRT